MKKINVIRDFSEIAEEGEKLTFTPCTITDLGEIYYCEEKCEYYMVSDVIVDLEK